MDRGTTGGKDHSLGDVGSDLEIEKAMLGGARVEKRVRKRKGQKPMNPVTHFNLENWSKFMYILYNVPNPSIS